jgi:hypothetical protein
MVSVAPEEAKTTTVQAGEDTKQVAPAITSGPLPATNDIVDETATGLGRYNIAGFIVDIRSNGAVIEAGSAEGAISKKQLSFKIESPNGDVVIIAMAKLPKEGASKEVAEETEEKILTEPKASDAPETPAEGAMP